MDDLLTHYAKKVTRPLVQPARDALAESQLSGLPGLYEGKGDAYRHAIWMAKTSRGVKDALGGGAVGTALGPIAAQVVGFIREMTTLPGDVLENGLPTALEGLKMDLSNNRAGAWSGVEDGADAERVLLEAARNARKEPKGAFTPGLNYRRDPGEQVHPQSRFEGYADLFGDPFAADDPLAPRYP